jgi:hypothetical protein
VSEIATGQITAPGKITEIDSSKLIIEWQRKNGDILSFHKPLRYYNLKQNKNMTPVDKFSRENIWIKIRQ